MGVDDGGEPAQQRRPVARARSPARTANASWARSIAASVSATEASGTSVTGCAVAGLMTVNVSDIQSLSNPRRSSQSVTAASKAASSTSAMFT